MFFSINMEISNIRLLAVLLAVISFSDSAPNVVVCPSSTNSEYIYDFSTKVEVGIEAENLEKHLNSNYDHVTSFYNVIGELSIKENPTPYYGGALKFQFKNVKFVQNYGDYNKKFDNKFENVPEDISDTGIPFVVYYKNGTFSHMTVGNNEKDWSINIKKSVVKTFYIPNFQKVIKNKNSFYHAYENTTEGYCKNEYSSYSTPSGSIITKVYSSESCEENDGQSVISRIQEGHGISGIKKYKIDKKRYNEEVLESIDANEKINYPQLGHQKIRFFAKTTQKFLLKEANQCSDATNEIPKGNEVTKEIHDLVFRGPAPNNAYNLIDLTNGRSNFHGNKQDATMQKLNEVFNFLQSKKLKANVAENLKSRIVNDVLAHMRLLSENEIKSIYEKLVAGSEMMDQIKRNMFYQLIPFVGTKSSVNFIVDLLKNGVSESTDEIENIINTMPFYIDYSKEMVESTKALMDVKESENINSQMKNDAILAFSIIFGKYCEKNSNAAIAYCKSDAAKSVVEQYFQGIADTSNNYLMKVVYLEGLKNLGTEAAVSRLIRIINKEYQMLENIRLRAAAGPNPITKHRKMVYKVYMPILTNANEEFDMRATALQILLDAQLEEHDDSTFNVHIHMATENCPQLYNYYYSLLQSYSDSINPHHVIKSMNAKKALNIQKRPDKKLYGSAAMIFNYLSEYYGFGKEIIIRKISDGKKLVPNHMYFEMNHLVNNQLMNELGIHIRTKGLQEILILNILGSMKSGSTDTFPEGQISASNYQAEVVFQLEGYTFSVMYDDSETEDSDMSELKAKGLAKLQNTLLTNYNFLEDSVHFSDAGVPIVFNAHWPSVYSSNIKADTSKDFSFTIDFRISSLAETNMLVFNPVSNSWHAVSKISTFEAQFPINIDLNLNKAKKSFSVSLEKTEGDLGVHKATKTYSGIFGGENVIPKNLMEATSETKDDKTNSDSSIFFTRSSFGCGENINDGIVFSGKNENSYRNSMKERFADFLFNSEYESYDPRDVECSEEFTAFSNFKKPRFTISIKFNGEEYGNKVPLPGYKFNVHTVIVASDGSGENSKSVSIYINTDADISPNSITTKVHNKISVEKNGEASGKQIIVDFEKKYPPLGKDAFVYGWGDETVTTSFSIKSCESGINTDSCPGFNINIKGEISDEQKKAADSNVYPYVQCKLDKEKSEWNGPLVPRTWACYEGALRLFYARKLTIDVATNHNFTLGKVLSEHLEQGMLKKYAQYLKHISPKERLPEKEHEHLYRLTINSSASLPTYDMSVQSKSGTFVFAFIPGSSIDLFNLQLDNTHFSKYLRILEATGIDKNCIASSASVLTPNNVTISHKFGSDYETLAKLKGSDKYGVYVKKGSNGLVAKIVIGDGTVELNGETATINGTPINGLDKGFQYPSDDPYYYFRVWSNLGQTTLYSRRTGLYVIYSPISVTASQPIIFKGFTEGICGDLTIDDHPTTN